MRFPSSEQHKSATRTKATVTIKIRTNNNKKKKKNASTMHCTSKETLWVAFDNKHNVYQILKTKTAALLKRMKHLYSQI